MRAGDGVALARFPEWTGRVMRVESGKVDVEFSKGGTGRFPEEDLVPVEVPVPADEDKAWPPRNLETKVPKH